MTLKGYAKRFIMADLNNFIDEWEEEKNFYCFRSFCGGSFLLSDTFWKAVKFFPFPWLYFREAIFLEKIPDQNGTCFSVWWKKLAIHKSFALSRGRRLRHKSFFSEQGGQNSQRFSVGWEEQLSKPFRSEVITMYGKLHQARSLCCPVPG